MVQQALMRRQLPQLPEKQVVTEAEWGNSPSPPLAERALYLQPRRHLLRHLSQ